MKQFYFISLLIFLFGSSVFAQQFEVSGEIRPRFELNNGQGALPNDSSDATAYISQRSRINLKYSSDIYQFFISFQDVRNWGEENIATGTGAFTTSGSTGMHQAWFQLKLSDASKLKIGRQVFSYDDQRLLAGRNWNQYGLAYDAVLMQYKKDSWQFDLALSYNNDSQKGTPAGFGLNNYYVDPIGRRLRTLNFAYIKKQINPNWSASATLLLTGYQKDKVSNKPYFMETISLFSKYNDGNLEAKANVIGQTGKAQNGKKVSAYLIAAEASYKLGKIKPGLGVDIISGHDASNQTQDYMDVYHSFDQLYGARFSFNGLLNQFSVPANVSNGGLVDIYPSLHFVPAAKHQINLEYHIFSLHKPVVKAGYNEYLEGGIGSELDISWQYAFSKELSTHVGFGYYFTNDNFAHLKRVNPAEIGKPYFGWVMLTYKPVLFKHSK